MNGSAFLALILAQGLQRRHHAQLLGQVQAQRIVADLDHVAAGQRSVLVDRVAVHADRRNAAAIADKQAAVAHLELHLAPADTPARQRQQAVVVLAEEAGQSLGRRFAKQLIALE
jgi:hypothetical protein